ncbi:MAG: Transcriptional regulatory protein YycF [candidate division BRC1 bacterium ADurb.BinA364]|nr:MAG: Transcriptional regulatory protein YycF [candidate division BRC1 bacterium ADurb.BinA364]
MAKRILIADDEQDIKDVVQIYLESQGYEVETAYDGLDALDRIETWKPDLVLLDIMMPVMDGISVCRKVKSSPATQHIPIIMVSAAAKAEKEAEARDAGATAYVLKPFEPGDLMKTVEKCLG